MTLGGMSLAVGILVDDATVEIENIHRNLAMRSPSSAPSSTARSEIAIAGLRRSRRHLHRLRSVALITGAARARSSSRSAMAVVFAMLTSYLLSPPRWCRR